MILYHGSNIEVPHPRILTTNRSLDFGAGFYTTSSHEQAERWAHLQALRRNDGCPYITAFEVSEDIFNSLNILRFEGPTEEWLDHITDNRTDSYNGERFDVVIGPVANDRTMSVINDYISQQIDRETALILLKPQKLTDQYCFRTAKALESLSCEDVIKLD